MDLLSLFKIFEGPGLLLASLNEPSGLNGMCPSHFYLECFTCAPGEPCDVFPLFVDVVFEKFLAQTVHRLDQPEFRTHVLRLLLRTVNRITRLQNLTLSTAL